MNVGQLLGIDRLRILQLEDERDQRVPPADVRPRDKRLRAGLPQRVVELLNASDRPLSTKEIGAALDCLLETLYQRIPKLLRVGLITRQGRRKHYVYWTPRKAEAA
jgi:biotin operon repressor